MPCAANLTIAVTVVTAIHLLAGCGQSSDSAPANTGIRLLAEVPDHGEFARAIDVRAFEFPRDHGTHPGFATEWWYFTGNLQTDSRRHFGFELTFFRYALSPQLIERESRWSSNEAWLAHFALTDTAGGRIILGERYARGISGVAQARDDRLDVSVKDWSARSVPGSASLQLELGATTDSAGIALHLTQAAAVALHGDRGLDRKGIDEGNASYYYSIPRFEVAGSISLDGNEDFDVSGTAWLDREWATSSLDPGVEGWDWFGLQLDNGDSVMLYRLRNIDGSQTAFSSGTLMRRDGTTEPLAADAVQYTARRHWRSPTTGVDYPVEWHIEIPAWDIELDVRPRIDDQEINLGLRYWEGAVSVQGLAGDSEVGGVGYLELAGYR